MKLSGVLVSLVLALAARGANSCRVVDSDHLYAADLAAVSPAFSVLNPAMEVGLSPLPGVTRVFHAADLLRLARGNGVALSAPPAEVCFERGGGSVRTAKPPAEPAPLAVHRGDRVQVKVSAGGVVLKFESEAESSGRPGDTVVIRNPENGNRFAARVEDQGKVTVDK